MIFAAKIVDGILTKGVADRGDMVLSAFNEMFAFGSLANGPERLRF